MNRIPEHDNGRGVAVAPLAPEQPSRVRPILGGLLVTFTPKTPGGRWRLWAAFEVGVATLVLTGLAWLAYRDAQRGRQLTRIEHLVLHQQSTPNKGAD